ncbi:HUL4 [Candida oxycetoniae]|uniref:HECT-type E3 ubiquitin transferase n=1 Tax=Candida oxycetoniae TaxID=497107 RepID=A0AAI9T0G5_9ASCO|nr:HUL4 [Candida oxycetoniae]KAI3406170.2 HUL4 [Candida oxycetoniae]
MQLQSKNKALSFLHFESTGPTTNATRVSSKVSNDVAKRRKGQTNSPGQSVPAALKSTLTPANSVTTAHSDSLGSLPSSSNSNSNSNSNSRDVCKCYCCGTILSFPNEANKYKCSICHTTNIMEKSQSTNKNETKLELSFKEITRLVEQCFERIISREEGRGGGGGKEGGDGGGDGDGDGEDDERKSLHEIFEPLSTYLYDAFRSRDVLNRAFKVDSNCKRPHQKTFNVCYSEIHEIFHLLTKLPTKRPLYSALKGAVEQLKRINAYFSETISDYHWIFVLLDIPILSRALVSNDPRLRLMSDVPEIKMLSYEILKRCLGILSCLDHSKLMKYFVSWFAKLDIAVFNNKVDVLNLYITFHLKKYFYLINNPRVKLASVPLHRMSSMDTDNLEYFQSLNLKKNIESNSSFSLSSSLNGSVNQYNSNPFPLKSSGKARDTKKESKIKVQQYGNDWHIKSALTLLSLLYKANKLRHDSVPVSNFYNTLVDYVNTKFDFDSWQRNKNMNSLSKNSSQPEIKSIIGYIHETSSSHSGLSASGSLSFYMCQYPFVISLGSKIAVLEYEARRQMERKAEEAFISSLDRRVIIDVHLKIRVRRDHIVQDSLHCIQSNMGNLRKSLKVQFVNEPGVDAGGLRKEWFMLLTKEIFHPNSGMFYNVEDSNLLWFNLVPVENKDMYYLFGAVLGLAIYNSTILDLQFPKALYKTVLAKPFDMDDCKEIFPQTFANLNKLRKMEKHELDALELTFEVTFTDVFGDYHNKELVPNGSNIHVNESNVKEYIEKYCMFFVRDGVKEQLDAFTEGFDNVIGGNALSLFSEEEIQLLLCGNDDRSVDVDILQSVTKYSGWSSNQEAQNSNVVQWFWHYLKEMNNSGRKRVLVFITGSDRIPATGIQNLPFKITLLNHGQDSSRLPLAHTCFNELAIYNYSSREKFTDKLNKAVYESAGFGIK